MRQTGSVVFLAVSIAVSLITACPFIRQSVNTKEKLDQIYLALKTVPSGFVPAYAVHPVSPYWAAATTSDGHWEKPFTIKISNSVQNFLLSITRMEIAVQIYSYRKDNI